MSIRLRLLLSYTAMLLVTLILFVCAAFLIDLAITGDPKNSFLTSHYTMKPLSQQEENLFLDMKYLAKKHSEQLLAPPVQEEFDKKLSLIHSGLLIRQDERIVDASPMIAIASVNEMPPFEDANIKVRDTFKLGERFFSYVKFDFYFADQSKGSLYMIKEESPYAELTRKFLPLLMLFLLVMLIVANGLLNFFVSRSIIKPLTSLRKATERISKGDLRFQVLPASKDEIGALCNEFEHMRQKLNESIELQLQYEENRKELISNISHDLKTPITSIIGYVEGIRDGVADSPAKMGKYLDTISRKARDMDLLIDDLFLFSKLDLKRLPFTFEQVELVAYLRDYVEELQFDLEEKGIRVTFRADSDSPVPVIADREKLKRVVANIFNNSVKYLNKQEKCIEVVVSTDSPQWATVRISDNGSGIESEALPYIFERFYRAEQSRNSTTGGSGLGLAIVKQMVTEHGGEIWATSEPGKGTSICFTLKRT
ncbi:MAG: ATP-binding protein [Clostridia bacterium]